MPRFQLPLVSIGTGIAGLSLVFAASAPVPTNANPPMRTFVMPAHRASATGRAPHVPGGRRRSAAPTPSCSSAPGSASGAFDDNTTFTTSNVKSFGFGNLASANLAGVFVGQANTVCDDESAIAGGYQNLVDSGNGTNSGVAQDSFIGAGADNKVSNTQSFIGAGGGNLVSQASSFVGAGNSNSAAGSTAFIGAGTSGIAFGNDSAVVAGFNNTTIRESSFVGGGVFGQAAGAGGFVGAGGDAYFNAQQSAPNSFGNIAGATDSFVGSGDLNQVKSSGYGSFIGAGGYIYATSSGAPAIAGNQIAGIDSFIGAGDQNSVAANEAFLGSGLANSISSAAIYGSLIGGAHNVVSATYGTVIGGYGNTASGSYAIVAGGNTDTASGILSYAAGYHADAVHNGSFVWSDYSSGSTAIKDTATNQFVVRASGGTYVYSNEAATAGVELAAGAGTWASLSDRNAKTDVAALDDASVLAKVTALPVSTWRYKSEKGVRHVGPMAQDFYAAFGVGEDNRHITSIDEDGVALSAIKALSAKMDLANANAERKDREIDALRAEVRRLEAASSPAR